MEYQETLSCRKWRCRRVLYHDVGGSSMKFASKKSCVIWPKAWAFALLAALMFASCRKGTEAEIEKKDPVPVAETAFVLRNLGVQFGPCNPAALIARSACSTPIPWTPIRPRSPASCPIGRRSSTIPLFTTNGTRNCRDATFCTWRRIEINGGGCKRETRLGPVLDAGNQWT